MSLWSVRWALLAERDLLRLPWREAERLAAAVQRFAETGEGSVKRVPGESVDELRLYAGSYFCRLTFDASERAIDVWHVRHRGA